VVFGASLISAGMKSKTPKWISFVDLSRKLEIPAAPPDFQRSLLLDLLLEKEVKILARKI
jgi:hypothetical protein